MYMPLCRHFLETKIFHPEGNLIRTRNKPLNSIKKYLNLTGFTVFNCHEEIQRSCCLGETAANEVSHEDRASFNLWVCLQGAVSSRCSLFVIYIPC